MALDTSGRSAIEQDASALGQNVDEGREVAFTRGRLEPHQLGFLLGQHAADGPPLRVIEVAFQPQAKMFDIELCDEDLLIPLHRLV